MITIFNRAEVAITYDAAKQKQIRQALHDHGIKSKIRVYNTSRSMGRTSGIRGRVGNAGVNAAVSFEYKIYVKRCDFDKAQDIVRSCR